MMPVLVGFALGWLGSMPIGGPVSLFVFRRGVSGRAWDGFLLALGAALAEAAYCAAALFGYGLLLDRWPWLRPVVGGLGGVILLIVGIHFLRIRREACAPPADGRIPPSRGWRELTLGFSMVAVNPSVLVNWLATLAALRAMGFQLLNRPAEIVFVTAVAAGIITWFALLLRILHTRREQLCPVFMSRALRGLGGVLCVTGLFALAAVFRRG